MASNTRKKINPAIEATSQASANAAKIVKEAPETDDMVVVNVPRGFRLSLDDYSQFEFHAGTQTVPREYAEHWYSQAHGVTIHKG